MTKYPKQEWHGDLTPEEWSEKRYREIREEADLLRRKQRGGREKSPTAEELIAKLRPKKTKGKRSRTKKEEKMKVAQKGTAEWRKQRPVKKGVLDYFPDAIQEVAFASWAGNQQHHPDKPLHWDKSKSTDELDALTRHMMDAGTFDKDGVRHSAKVAWRALANLQRELDREEQELFEEEIIAASKEKDIMYFPHLEFRDPCCLSGDKEIEEELEKRMNIIGQNGNDGLHYEEKFVRSSTLYPGDIKITYNENTEK